MEYSEQKYFPAPLKTAAVCTQERDKHTKKEIIPWKKTVKEGGGRQQGRRRDLEKRGKC